MADLIIIKIFLFIFSFIFFKLGKISILFYYFFSHFFSILFLEKIDFFFNYFFCLLDCFFFKFINIEKFFINFYDFKRFHYLNFLEDKNIVYVRSPLFIDNYYFFFSKNCSLWENYWYLNNLKYYEDYSSLNKFLSVFNNFLFDYNSKDILNFSFFNNLYKFKMNDFFLYNIYRPVLNYGFFLDSDKFFLRFPRKLSRFNNLDFIISNSDFFSNLVFPKNNFKFSFQQNQIYSSTQIGYINPLGSQNIIDKWVFFYFKSLNANFNNYYNLHKLNSQNNNYIYLVSQTQILHLLKLNYYEIQFILKLINEDPFFHNRNFVDVHWELYSHLINFNNYEQVNSFFLKNENIPFSTYLPFKIFTNKIGLYNPFELIYSSNFYTFKSDKKFTISEKDLCILPFHILLSSKNHLFNNEFFINDILIKNRSNFFLNIFQNTGFLYSQKLFQYQQYYLYNKNNIASLLGETFLKKISYQHFDPSIHNPWWESLTLSSKKKILLLLQNFSFSQIHLITLNLLDRYISGKFFYQDQEISSLLNLNQYLLFYNNKFNNINYLNTFLYLENSLNFCFRNNGLFLDYPCFIEFNFNKNVYKEYYISSNILTNQYKFNCFFFFSKKYLYEYFYYKNILFSFCFFSSIFYENNFFFFYDYNFFNSNIKENDFFLYHFFDYENFKNFTKTFFLNKGDFFLFFNEQYQGLLMYYFISFFK
jgi:hypothetical protein